MRFFLRPRVIRWWSRRPRVAVLLILVMLIPVGALAALTGSSALRSWSDRDRAITVQRDASDLVALMAARVAVTNEYVASAALVEGAAFKLSAANIKSMFGIDYEAQLRRARPVVDASQVLRSYATLAAEFGRVRALRRQIDAATAAPNVVIAAFTHFTADIDAQWAQQFSRLRQDVLSGSSGTGKLSARAAATSTVFALLTTAKSRYITCGDAVKGIGTPASVKQLIAANGAFGALSASFPQQLGTHAAAAWRAWQRDPAAQAWEKTVAETVSYALAGKPSPMSGNALECGRAFINEPVWLNGLSAVAQGSAADMRDLARHEEVVATGSCRLDGAIFILSVLLGAGASFLLARAVVRPLRRLAAAAHEVAEGSFTRPPVAAAGPREVAETIAAVNDMTSVLSAVERFTVTLADDPAAPSLDVPLPGRTGRALQETLTRLRESVLDTEQQRAILQEVAAHDGLTGLLNRRAAHAAVEALLAGARREGHAVMAMFLDLDGLKQINDNHGHVTGDAAIRLTAQALRAAARESDVVARIGGDEFLVVGDARSGGAGVNALAVRLQQTVASILLPTPAGPIALHCSVGISLSTPEDDVESLVARADQALYGAKRRGRLRRSAAFRR
jgi:diguanylate cyclase (GGDEF)-like protein